MNCSKKSSFIIKGDKLRYHYPNYVSIQLKKQMYQIIKGTVYDYNHKPCKAAVIQVTQISRRDHTKCVLGYAITDKNGHYLFSIKALPCMLYELDIYSPLL